MYCRGLFNGYKTKITFESGHQVDVIERRSSIESYRPIDDLINSDSSKVFYIYMNDVNVVDKEDKIIQIGDDRVIDGDYYEIINIDKSFTHITGLILITAEKSKGFHYKR